MKKVTLILLFMHIMTSFAQQITQAGAWSNNPNFLLEYSQNKIIVSDVTGVKFIDISNPSTPVLSSSIPVTGYGYRMKAQGNYLYVGGGMSSILDVVDISNINSPLVIGTTPNVSGQIYGIDVKGNYLYAVTSDTLDVIDVSNKTNPTIPKKVNIAGITQGIAIVGNYAYVATQAGLKIIDISNPLNPVILSTYGSGYYGEVIADITNNRIFASTNIGFEAIDISNPTTLVQLFVGGSSSGGNLSYYNGRVFQLGTTSSSVNAYKVTVSSSTYLCTFNGIGQANDVYALDSMIFLSTVNYVYVLQFSSFGGVDVNNMSNYINELKSYPNPARKNIEFDLGFAQDNTAMSIYNSVGQIIANFSTNDQKLKLDISNYKPGIYFLLVGRDEPRHLRFSKE